MRRIRPGIIITGFLVASLAGAAGAAASARPETTFLALAGVLAMTAVVFRPTLAVILVLTIEGLSLLFTLSGVDAAALSYGSSALAAVGAMVARSRANRPLPTGVHLGLASGGLALAGSAGIGLLSGLPPVQVGAGLRLFLTPVLCALIAVSTTRTQAVGLLRVATLLMVASAVASLVQQQLGVAGLLDAGLTYGVSVRSFGEDLRAPGLFATNYSLGAFAGVLGGLAATWWPALVGRQVDRAWRVTAVAASISCLLTSIYRTGILVLVISVALWVAVSRETSTTVRRVVVSLAGVGGLAYIFGAGIGETGSVVERWSVWENVLEKYGLSLSGLGFASVGGATNSRFAAEPVVVDNYYLSLLLQMGVLAMFVLIPIFLATGWMLVRARQDPILLVGTVLAACLMAFVFVDFWEYTGAMSLAFSAAAAAAGLHHRGVSGELVYPPHVAPRR